MINGRNGSGALRTGCLLAAWLLAGCEQGDTEKSTPPPQFGEFTNPQLVTIQGYSDHAMEPFISRDGQYLFFNNSNDPAVDTNLYWAQRVDDLTFQYQGEIGGVNTTALDGVASMDAANVFYFISNRTYAQTASIIHWGSFANGAVTGVELVPGVSTATPGIVNFDAEISPGGTTLYFVESQFDSNNFPQTADLLIAERSGAGFVRLSNSAAILHQVNTMDSLEYAPAISTSGRELFFTRLNGTTSGIYTATRPSTSVPFEAPAQIAAITGFVEAPTLSPDEKSLYYHKNENSLFVIYRLTRP